MGDANTYACSLLFDTTNYSTASLCTQTAIAKCSGAFFPTVVKAILCNWMVSLALFLAGASNDLAGKMVGCWLPISTFVAIGLEHSVANMFLLPAAMMAIKGGTVVGMASSSILTWKTVIFKNLIPVLLGNAIAGALVVAASYSYQFGKLGERSRNQFLERLQQRANQQQRRRVNGDEKTKVNGGDGSSIQSADDTSRKSANGSAAAVAA